MPFLLYRIDDKQFEYVRPISLAGLNGPFCSAAKCKPKNPEWEVDENSLLKFFGVTAENHAIVIDLKPGVADEVSFYRLKHAWGYSANGWTPMAFEIETLYVDYKPPRGKSTAAFKQLFPSLQEAGEQIYEFLYLNGDGREGKWTWGRVGSVNAPLLWCDVFDSFLKRINKKRRDIDRLQPLGNIN